MKKLLENTVVIFFVYVAGIVVYLVFLLLKLFGKIKIKDEIPKLKPGMMVIANHPDLMDCMFEIFLLPAMFVPQVFLHPIKLCPWFTPDKKNFTDKWYWAWLRIRAISIDRAGGAASGANEARSMLSALKQYGPIIHFAEGGRTCTGTTFHFSQKRKLIRRLKPSLGFLVRKTKAKVLPVWLENGKVELVPKKPLFSFPNLFSGPITVKFGTIIEPTQELVAQDSAEVTEVVAQNLLELADRE